MWREVWLEFCHKPIRPNQDQSGHRNWPNTSCIRSPRSRLDKVTCIYMCFMICSKKKRYDEIIPKKPSSHKRRRLVFSCLVGERELGCIGIWVSWKCFCVLLYLPNFLWWNFSVVSVEVGSLLNHVNSCVFCVCLLFNFRLFTVIDLSPEVLFAQH